MSNIATIRPAVPREISRRDLDVMMTTAAAQSRRLARSLRLSPAEQEDAEQDILVMLIERWHYFDDSRGSNVAFAIRIGRQAAQVIADRIVSGWERETVSLDASLDAADESSSPSLADTLADDTLPSEAALVEAIALKDVLGSLAEGLCGHRQLHSRDRWRRRRGPAPVAALFQRIPPPSSRTALPAGVGRARSAPLAVPPMTSWENLRPPSLL